MKDKLYRAYRNALMNWCKYSNSKDEILRLYVVKVLNDAKRKYKRGQQNGK